MATFTAGTSFTDGVTGDVTAAKLNALVADATPLANFITDRTAETSLATDDLVLISDTSDSGALNKMTVANFTNVVSTGTGTAASPAIRPTGDTNTGIFFPAADTAAIATQGTEAMRIDSSGRVGIGTTSPSYKLVVSEGGAQGFEFQTSSSTLVDLLSYNRATSLYTDCQISTKNFIVSTGTSSASERLRIDSSGNVGIGTTSPASLLELALARTDTAGSGALTLNGTQKYSFRCTSSAPSNGLAIDSFNGASWSTPLVIDNSGQVGIGTTSPSYRMSIETSAQTVLSCNSTNANGGYAAFLRSGSQIGFIGSAQPLVSGGSNDNFAIRAENNLVFATNTNTERLRITSGGQLLVGATSEVTGLVKLFLSDGTINSGYGYKTNGVEYVGTFTNHPLAVITNNSERLRIDSSGNVGVGTTSPSTKLHVASGNLRLDDNQYILWGGTTNGINGNNASNLLAFYTNSAERLRITSGGEVYIAGTTDQGAYNLQVNGTGVWGAGAYVNGSDERLKENIQDITSGLDVIEKLRPVSFQYKEEYTADRSVQSGFIAQDLLVALEGKNYLEGVVSQGPTYYNVAYQNLIPILAKAIQDLKAINDSQAQTITSLESRIAALEAA